MKTQNLLLYGALAFGAYYLYKESMKAKNGGSSIFQPVDQSQRQLEDEPLINGVPHHLRFTQGRAQLRRRIHNAV